MTSHLLGIVVAAVAAFMFGALWYSPMLFGHVWARESGTPEEHNPSRKAQARFMAILLALLLVSAAVLDCVLTDWAPGQGLTHGLSVGFLGGVLAATVVGMDTLFERKSLRLFFINSAYYLFSFIVMGFLLSLL
ncbi:MAG TPA: DUF1761 domain-containing protein [Gammaproteobacteria bacterium]|nr:DUF1761 domain-containing protein [Gammaproteobacteria bacterium]